MRRLLLAGLAIAGPLLALEPPSQSRPSLWPRPSPEPTIRQDVEKRPFTNNPSAGGLSVDGTEEPLRPGTLLTITFPTAMVPPDRIDVEDSESPIELSPSLDIHFTWRTQSQGELLVKGPLIPAESYQFRLREGTRDLSGKSLEVSAWGLEMTTPPLRVVEEGYGERDNLNANPQIPLEFNYPVRLAHAADCVWFQDRVNREKFPAEILLNVAEGKTDDAPVVEAKETTNDVTAVRVRPLQSLPVGRRYDLVVDGISDAYGGRSMRYPQVFPIGATRSLQIDYVAARNFPLETPRVEVKFTQTLGDEELPQDALQISPAVSRLNVRRDGSFLVAEGDFKPNSRYSVTVSEKILGTNGYGLVKPETWGASFRPKESAILFPAQQIRQRSVLGLKFAFYQVNTSELEWKLADVPLDKLPSVLSREREFDKVLEDSNGRRVWTQEGTFQRQTSQPLISELGLRVIASGIVPAAGEDKEVLREIAWKSDDSTVLTGAKLLEVTGRDFQGKVMGNRALIYFGEVALTRKLTKSHSVIRAAHLSDAKPLVKSVVTALDKDLTEIARSPIDENGMATFDVLVTALTKYFFCGGTLQPVALSDQFPGASLSARPPPALRTYTLTDRPLYRPGQSIQFKGFVREDHSGTLKIPLRRALKWTIERAYASEVLASGEAQLDAEGGWNGTWTPPTDSPIGEFVLKAVIGGQSATPPARFQIQEFRNPPFSVIFENLAATKPAESVIGVQSQYFHGAPNAGSVVKWTATWVSDSTGGEYGGGDDWTRVDSYSEHAKHPDFTAETSGEAVLDGSGSVVLRCDPPFKDPGNRARCQVIWRVDVTGPDGQTITGGTTHNVPMAPVLLGIKRGESDGGKVQFFWNAEEAFATAPEAVNVQLFHVQTKSVKERLAPNVYRYRNFDQYELVEERQQVTEDSLAFTPGRPGRYVALISPLPGAPGFPVSEEAYLAGDEASEVPVQSDTSATVFSVKAGTRESGKPWLVGEKAVLNVLAPSGGVAWVSVETDKLLHTFTTPLNGNTSRIEIPIKPEYEPNVFISVYLLRPGGSDQLAGEMYGYDQLAVQAPDRALEISVRTSRPEYEPREKVSGEVTVKAAGRPLAGADLLIYAVDDSILTLGGWSLPSMLANFFPARNFAVVTSSALKAYVDKIVPSWLTMKGYVAGDAGAEQFGNVAFTRKEFKPLILWQPAVRTNAKGVAKFECEAPDNLTRFRIVAVGQTRSNQFGAGDATFAVSKKLLIEPALPRFLREGDQVELRAVARQKVSDSEKLTVRCTVGGSLELEGIVEQEISAARDTPAIVRFQARASSTGWANAKFEVKSAAKLMDAVEVPLPVTDPVIPQKESVSGLITAPTLSAREVMPPVWRQGRGTFDLAVSTTPWLSKLVGLPFLLEYPHGCLEQKSSRLLAYTLLGGLLEYLPEVQARRASYEHVIRETLREFETALLPDGRLPYWAGGTEANDFVTIQTAWCVNQAERAGFDVPERLSTELTGALEEMVSGRVALSPTLRAFATFALSDAKENSDLAASAATELFLQRDKLSGEGKATLAIAMHHLGLEPEKQRVLISELPSDFSTISFNPETFASATRTEALCGWARLLVEPEKGGDPIRDRLLKLTESSASLSTQENLWLLVTFNAIMRATPTAQLAGTNPPPETRSANGTAGSWSKQDLTRLADFAVSGLQPGGSFVLRAEYRPPSREVVPIARGLSIGRVTKNLTDASRDGSDRAPYRLGDQILISYRISSEKPQSYIVIEDPLPAGLEVVNPNLDLFGKFYSLPAEADSETADLSHSEMRDQQTNLYFDELPAGTRSYSVLARATAAGSFIWPATQISPMYDSRFFGRSASSECRVEAP
jgi:alpha-2-macroglobulin